MGDGLAAITQAWSPSSTYQQLLTVWWVTHSCVTHPCVTHPCVLPTLVLTRACENPTLCYPPLCLAHPCVLPTLVLPTLVYPDLCLPALFHPDHCRCISPHTVNLLPLASRDATPRPHTALSICHPWPLEILSILNPSTCCYVSLDFWRCHHPHLVLSI